MVALLLHVRVGVVHGFGLLFIVTAPVALLLLLVDDVVVGTVLVLVSCRWWWCYYHGAGCLNHTTITLCSHCLNRTDATPKMP